MTSQDILNGYMIVAITISLIHPAEFIELTFTQDRRFLSRRSPFRKSPCQVRPENTIWPLPEILFLGHRHPRQSGFSRKSPALESEVQVIEYRAGNSKSFAPIKMPGAGESRQRHDEEGHLRHRSNPLDLVQLDRHEHNRPAAP